MPMGGGKYTNECTLARNAAQADAAILLIINGRLGQGFEVQTTDPQIVKSLPKLLRGMADQIEEALHEMRAV
jgi:hypothetical protein